MLGTAYDADVASVEHRERGMGPCRLPVKTYVNVWNVRVRSVATVLAGPAVLPSLTSSR